VKNPKNFIKVYYEEKNKNCGDLQPTELKSEIRWKFVNGHVNFTHDCPTLSVSIKGSDQSGKLIIFCCIIDKTDYYRVRATKCRPWNVRNPNFIMNFI